MVTEDVVVTTNRLPEELYDAAACHFDNRALQLERGLYVIRERINRQRKENPSAACEDYGLE